MRDKVILQRTFSHRNRNLYTRYDWAVKVILEYELDYRTILTNISWLRFSYELAPVRGFVNGRVQLCKVYHGKSRNFWSVYDETSDEKTATVSVKIQTYFQLSLESAGLYPYFRVHGGKKIGKISTR